MGSRRSARILALQALYQLDMESNDIGDVLRLDWIDKKYDEQTLAFARELIEGSVKHARTIDDSIKKQLEHWDLERLSYVDRAILRFSTFSLFFQDDVPDTVIINEAVDLAKQFGTDDSYRFVNGVLDGIRKEKNGRDT
ncbi:MAG TPA: transcription antitermination factor NusB [Spirochaetota bacterium]|nr:transcription antitermination factor NusB [Spirochaetota bacterium]